MATPKGERSSAPASTGPGGTTPSNLNDCDSATSGSSVTISTSTHTTPRNSASSITSNTGGNCTAAAAATNNNNSPAGPTENGGDKSQVTPGAPGSSGHKGSIRGNKLARRARSFKDDFLEKISQIRTPTSTMTRSHSPNSPRSGSAGGGGGVGGNRKSDDLLASSKPVQDLNYHVRQVKNALTHFKDVILKNKLEMLPGNGTVVLELVANVHTALQSYTLNENSSALINATNHVYMSLGNLLKLCDEVLLTADNENCPSLSKENVKEIVELVENAVNNLVNLANEKISDKAAGSGCSGNHHSSNTLQRPAVDIAGQRTSLPDIPLTPRERDILEQTSLKTVRASHSTESILRDSSPPPKPPLPDRAQDPPPLPPKRKSQHSKNHSFHETSDADSTFLGGGCGGALDRMSLRSRSPEDNSSLLSASAGSLDSALNHSREEDELRALTTNTSSSAITTATIHDKASLLGLGQACRNNSNIWDEADCSGMQLLSGGGPIPTDIAALNNRNSNESGFESMYSLRISRDHQTSSSTSYKSSNTYSSSSSSTTNSQLHKSESILDAMGSLGGGGKLISLITTGQQLQQQQQQQHHHHSNNGQQQQQQQHNNQLTVTSMASVIGGHSSNSSMGNSLNHSHLIHSRPSSTGHLTPTPGSVTPTNAPSPVDIRHINVGGGGGGNSSHLPDYDSPVSSNAHKRPRISEGWAT
uniref:Guanine nucleotide-releasing factor 2 n=1 Tax=Culex pipiens TaxID=7175 RepID=A0A8D8MZP8_CULPI